MAGGNSPWLPEQCAVLAPAVTLFAATRGADLAAEAINALRTLLDEFRYVVVDEIVDDHALLVASEWPQVDDEGRRLFPDRDEDDPVAGRPLAYEEVGVDLGALQRLLDGHRLGNGEERRREVRIGDVFAMTRAALAHLVAASAPAGEPRGQPPADESDLVVVDVTRSARGAAKAAFSRVVSPGGSGPEPPAPLDPLPPNPDPGPPAAGDDAAGLRAPPDPEAALRDITDLAYRRLPEEPAALADRQAGHYSRERPGDALLHLVTDLQPSEADREAREFVARVRAAVSDPLLPAEQTGRVLRRAARLLEDPRAVSLAAASVGLLHRRLRADDRRIGGS